MSNKLQRIKQVAVYCGSHSPADPAYDLAAANLGKFLALNNMTLIFGGSNVGTMKVLADSVLENGGKVIGVFTEQLSHEILHPDLSETVITANLAERKAEMLRLADVVVALPGSFGTWDELFDALALRKMKNAHKCPVGVLNVNGYFDHLLKFIAHSIEVGFTTGRHAQLLKSASTPELLFRQLAGSMVPESSNE